MSPNDSIQAQDEMLDKKNILAGSVWKAALLVAFGWLLSNIIIFFISSWFLSGGNGVEFEPHLGAALLLGILGLLAGFSLSVALWISQVHFIGLHAFAYTVLVAILTGSFAYVPDGIFIMPILLIGLYIAMKWANPAMNFTHILASFLVWLIVAMLMSLVILISPYQESSELVRLFWQSVWSFSVGLFGSAFMFWQLNKKNSIEINLDNPTRIEAERWQKVFNAW